MTWMNRWAAGLRCSWRRRRARDHRRRRPRLRRPLPRRHRGDGRPRAAPIARRSPRRRRAASRRCCRPRTRPGSASELARRFGLPLWQFATSRHRRQPLRAALRPPGHRAAEDRWSSTGATTAPSTRRCVDARRGRPRRRRSPAAIGPPVDPSRDHASWSSSTTSTALERGARRRRRRLRAGRAGADQHRHRAARRRATTTRCARSPARTARCWSSTRPTRSVRRPRRLHARR